MKSVGTLLGFDARMPGILSFVSPVFWTPERARTGQVSQEEGGVVQCFREVSASRGFMAASASLCVVSGDPRLYAFQTTDKEIVAGDARRLAQFLVRGSEQSVEFLQSHTRTKAAIDRFILMAENLKPPRKASSLYVLRRQRVTGPFLLAEIHAGNSSKAPPLTLEAAVRSLRSLVWRGLRDGHSSSFGGHAAFGAAVRSHIDSGGVVANEAAAIVASNVVADHRWWVNTSKMLDGQACARCGLSLVYDYPSQSGIEGLLRLVAAILQGAEHAAVPAEGDTLQIAMAVLAKYFHEISPASASDALRDEFVFLLKRLEAGQGLREGASVAVRGVTSNRSDDLWIPKGAEESYVDAMQGLNARFDAITSTLELAGEEA